MTDEREIFEQWLLSGPDIFRTAAHKKDNGDYLDRFVQDQWVAWQAAIASSSDALAAKDAEIERKRLALVDMIKFNNEHMEMIRKQAAHIDLLNKEWEEAALLIGVCGAGKCNADMWADPPRDCDAPNCLDLIAGIKKAKEKIEQQAAEIERLNREHREAFNAQESLLGEYVAKIEQLQAEVEEKNKTIARLEFRLRCPDSMMQMHSFD